MHWVLPNPIPYNPSTHTPLVLHPPEMAFLCGEWNLVLENQIPNSKWPNTTDFGQIPQILSGWLRWNGVMQTILLQTHTGSEFQTPCSMFSKIVRLGILGFSNVLKFITEIMNIIQACCQHYAISRIYFTSLCQRHSTNLLQQHENIAENFHKISIKFMKSRKY